MIGIIQSNVDSFKCDTNMFGQQLAERLCMYKYLNAFGLERKDNHYLKHLHDGEVM